MLESPYVEYPDNSGYKVALPQETDALVLCVRNDPSKAVWQLLAPKKYSSPGG